MPIKLTVTLSVAMLATVLTTGCNVNQEASAQNAAGTPVPAATVGQDNGSLTSNLPNASDLRRRFHSGVSVATSGHQQTHRSL